MSFPQNPLHTYPTSSVPYYQLDSKVVLVLARLKANVLDSSCDEQTYHKCMVLFDQRMSSQFGLQLSTKKQASAYYFAAYNVFCTASFYRNSDFTVVPNVNHLPVFRHCISFYYGSLNNNIKASPHCSPGFSHQEICTQEVCAYFFYLLSYQCLYNYKLCYPIRIFSMFSSIYRQNKITAYTLLAAAFKKAILNLNLYRWPVTCISVNFFSNFIRGVQGKT